MQQTSMEGVWIDQLLRHDLILNDVKQAGDSEIVGESEGLQKIVQRGRCTLSEGFACVKVIYANVKARNPDNRADKTYPRQFGLQKLGMGISLPVGSLVLPPGLL